MLVTARTAEKDFDNKWVTALRALVYYVTTTLIAVLLGVAMVSIMRPGVGRGESITRQFLTESSQLKPISTIDTVLDLFR
jgi:Na+/H+-dicarboxylate symporter